MPTTAVSRVSRAYGRMSLARRVDKLFQIRAAKELGWDGKAEASRGETCAVRAGWVWSSVIRPTGSEGSRAKLAVRRRLPQCYHQRRNQANPEKGPVAGAGGRAAGSAGR